MNAILEQINSAGYVFVEFALPMLAQSSVLIVVLLLADLLLRKKVRAVFRYWLWMLVLLKLILPTTLSSPISLGSWFGDELAGIRVSDTSIVAQPVNLPQMTETRTVAEAGKPSAVTPLAGVEPTVAAAVDTEPVVIETATLPLVSPTPITWQGIVFLVWAAGVVAMGLLLLQRAIFVNGLIAQAKNPTQLMNDAFRFCCGQMGLKGKVGLKVSANTTSPAVCGLFRPVILLPQNLAPTLGSSRLRPVLLHELAHIKRGDLWINLAQTILQIIYFYNPLLWLANSVIRRIREQAVDEAVQVAMGDNAPQYPQTLVDVAKMAFSRPALSLRLIGVVESKSALKGRIKRLLSRPIPKTAKLGILGLIALLIFAAVLLPMAKAKDKQQTTTDYSFVTVKEGVGFDDIIVGDLKCTGEFIKSKLGEPDKEVKNEKDWWLNYRKTYGLGFWVNPQENVLIEIRLNKGFKGKLTSGISMSSKKQDVFDVYGEPIREEVAEDFDQRFDDRVLLFRKPGWSNWVKFRGTPHHKIYYNDKGLLFWFDGDAISQIVVYRAAATNKGKKGERPDINEKKTKIIEKLVVLTEHRDRVQRDLDSAERALGEVRDRWGFSDLEEHSYPHPVTERLNRLQKEQDDCTLEISQLKARIENLKKVSQTEQEKKELKDTENRLVELQGKFDALEKMRSDAEAQRRELDLARIQYKQRAAIRDERLQRLNELKSQIEKLRLMHDNPEAFDIELEVEEKSKAGMGTIDVAAEDFKIRPYPAGGLYTVTVAIRNKGSQEAPPFRLNFYQGDPANNLNLHGKPQTGSHGAGPIKPGNVWNESSSPFALKDGLNEIVVVLDMDGRVAESDELNNQASMKVVVKDGRIIEKSVSYSPQQKVESSESTTDVQLEAEGTGGKELEKIAEQVVMTISTCAESDPRVKQSLESLQGLDEQAVVKEVVKFLDSDKNTVRRSAIYILWKGDFESVESAVPHLQNLCSHEEEYTRGMAALALGEKKAEPSFDTLCNLTLNDSSAYARRCAAYALGLMGNPEAKGVLENALKDLDFNVRSNAEAALTMLSQIEKPKSTKPETKIEGRGSPIRKTKTPAEQSQLNEAVYKQLDGIVDLSELKPEMAFSEAIEVLKNSVDPPLKMFVNWRDLYDNADIDQETPINMDAMPAVRLSMALKLLFKSVSGDLAELDYVVEDGIIFIATRESLPTELETSVYDISDLIGSAANADDIAQLVIHTVEPYSWEGAGGEGTIAVYHDKKLIVYQTHEIHKQIQDLLQGLQASSHEQRKSKTEVK